MSELREGVAGIKHRTYESVRHRYDPTTGEANIYLEKPISEDEFLRMQGISEEVTRAREQQYEKVMRYELSNTVEQIKRQLEDERAGHKEEMRRLHEELGKLTETVVELKADLAKALESKEKEKGKTEDVDKTDVDTKPDVEHEDQPPLQTDEAEETTADETETPGNWSTVVEEHQENITEVEKDSQHRNRLIGRAALVGTLIALAAGGLGMSIWNHHELDELEHGQNRIAMVENGSSSGETGLSMSLSGIQTVKYNPNAAYPRTAVELTKQSGLSLSGHPGRYNIVDKNGRIVVHHTQWDQQHKLSRATRNILRTKGYTVNQGHFGKYFKTVVSGG